MKEDLDIQFFLHMGYFPRYESKVSLDLSSIQFDLLESLSDTVLLEKCHSNFQASIENLFETGKKHVIPLSGGMDSRAILSALASFTEAHNIETYTFGIPGTCDFDIGCEVARLAQTKHTAVDLSKTQWSESEIFSIAKMNDAQTFLFHHPPLSILERYKDCIIWSGYIGDAVTGGHLKNDPAFNLDDAKKRYLLKRREVKSMSMIERSLEDFLPYVGGEEFIETSMSHDERVLFSEVGKVTAPHVLLGDYNYKMPFINSPFFDFIMAAPQPLRHKQKLFLSMCHSYYPSLFDLPSKTYYGLRHSDIFAKVLLVRARNRIWRFLKERFLFLDIPALPMTNYFDYDHALRNDDQLKELVHSHLIDLKERQCVEWLDIETLWQDHLTKRFNRGDALMILFSLEINLKIIETDSAQHRRATN